MNGYEALRTEAAYIDLSARGKIQASGDDRLRLIHAMCTNDVLHLADGSGLSAFFLSAQGRVLADAHVYNRGESVWLDTEPETADSLFQHLDKYIIADDVTLQNKTADWVAYGLEGPHGVEAAGQMGLPVPGEQESIAAFENGFVARTAAAGMDGVRIFLPLDDRGSLLERLRNLQIVEADQEAARAVRIELKRPRYGDDISERYLVQETQQTRAVHFNKGCYLGQEIVERVRSRGQVHRLLTPIAMHGSTAPEAGAKLTMHSKEVGEVTSAVFSPALGQVIGFAYLRGDGLQGGAAMTVHVDSVAEEATVRL